MTNNSPIKTIVATGIGSALFVIIGIFVNIPIFANTSIQLQYALQALLATLFGPVAGFLVGFIGHTVKDAIQYGNLYWAWLLASGVVGLVIGLFRRFYDVSKGDLSVKSLVAFNLVQVVANALAYGLVAPVGDRVLYAQEWSYLLTQGAIAGLANALTIALGGTLLLSLYAKSRTKSGSLSKD